MFDHVLYDFVHLFVIFNPVGIVPQFLYFTRNVPVRERRALTIKCVVIATSILVTFIVLGQITLEALGIGIPAFSIAGGLVLFIISMRMIFESVDEPVEKEKGLMAGLSNSTDLAVFPLATPLIAGPGGIMVVVLLTNNSKESLPDQVATTLVLLVIMVLTCLVLLASGTLLRVLGKTGISVASRMLGLILAALSVQTVLTGLLDTVRTAFSLS
ncbi:MAG: MarC family protein [Actinomycetota bacterium]|nr:MarC family protein [Actinomycetota bacterium]